MSNSLDDIQIVVTAGSVFAAFDRLRRIDTRKVFQRLRPDARKDQREHADKQEGPDGAWPPLAPSTIERRARMAKTSKRNAKPRKILGRVPAALTSKISAKSLILMSRIKRWSMVHQRGARVGRGSIVPRRQYLWISHNLRKATKREFESALAKVFRGLAP